MRDSLAQASSIFGRCESCMKNLVKSICGMNCSPKQSKFLLPEIKKNEGIKIFISTPSNT